MADECSVSVVIPALNKFHGFILWKLYPANYHCPSRKNVTNPYKSTRSSESCKGDDRDENE